MTDNRRDACATDRDPDTTSTRTNHTRLRCTAPRRGGRICTPHNSRTRRAFRARTHKASPRSKLDSHQGDEIAHVPAVSRSSFFVLFCSEK
jgi:hypothetical protein